MCWGGSFGCVREGSGEILQCKEAFGQDPEAEIRLCRKFGVYRRGLGEVGREG